jgi:hypothetical protein
MECALPTQRTRGLGIHDLEIKNIALLSKWLFSLLTEHGIWQTLLKRKYVGSKTLSQMVWKPGDSHFWTGLMTSKKHFFRFGTFSIKDGSQIRFWEDKWLGSTTLREQYPALYSIVRYKEESIAIVMESFPPNVTFRRDLIGTRLDTWISLLHRLSEVQLSVGTDEFHWNLSENGFFSVSSLYNALVQPVIPV